VFFYIATCVLYHEREEKYVALATFEKYLFPLKVNIIQPFRRRSGRVDVLQM
jgi:hypothetical protein